MRAVMSFIMGKQVTSWLKSLMLRTVCLKGSIAATPLGWSEMGGSGSSNANGKISGLGVFLNGGRSTKWSENSRPDNYKPNLEENNPEVKRNKWIGFIDRNPRPRTINEIAVSPELWYREDSAKARKMA